MPDTIDWEAAINTRRSVRSYEPRPVEAKTMSDLREFAQSGMQIPFEHSVKVRFFKAPPGSRLYALKMAPPDNVAFMAKTDVKSISAAGFVGEMVILYATALGLATCWYGHYSMAELERLLPHLGEAAAQPQPKWGYGSGVVPGERAICISPVGYWEKGGIRLADRLTGAFISYKRKPVGELLEGGVKEEDLPREIAYAIDLARKAPSAANSQHWRFTVSPDFKTVTIAMPAGYRHLKWEHPDVDIGICACHFWLGLGLQNVGCRVSPGEEEGRAVWRFEL
ncbi:nitroreductase family protein [Methanocella arvoryzae]|uniref:Putative nitroreductase TM1586 domain-containing protein n=1 Tax=Methanocella arvoryzae (strain DSM 22066 / NBRC 105507 / MRE50) TaxID=351160 RepID=Q0W449_METAR|nr:nitroreductase family protein [Methanocella arvoryzae]CAJ36844.1 hypothetical protein RCIX1600 [Methanocella arvoryzae MRE50]